MGIVGWFLSVHFLQLKSSSLVSFYLNQSGFASNLVESFFGETREASPLATPYCFGVPVDLIAPSTDKADSLAQTCWTQAYKSLIGSISWLAMTTCPDLTTIHSFFVLLQFQTHSWSHEVGHLRLTVHPFHLWLRYHLHLKSHGPYVFQHSLSSIYWRWSLHGRHLKPSTTQTLTTYSNAYWAFSLSSSFGVWMEASF